MTDSASHEYSAGILLYHVQLVKKKMPEIPSTHTIPAALALSFAASLGYGTNVVNAIAYNAQGDATGWTEEATGIMDKMDLQNTEKKPLNKTKMGSSIGSMDLKSAFVILSKIGTVGFTRTHHLGAYSSLPSQGNSSTTGISESTTRLRLVLRSLCRSTSLMERNGNASTHSQSRSMQLAMVYGFAMLASGAMNVRSNPTCIARNSPDGVIIGKFADVNEWRIPPWEPISVKSSRE